MITIHLRELRKLRFNDIYKLIMNQDGVEYSVILPNPVKKKKEDTEAILDYHTAGYAGQLLSDVSSCFGYYVPYPFSGIDFTFEFIIKDREKFIDALYEIKQVYYGPADINVFDYSAELAISEEAACDGLFIAAFLIERNLECSKNLSKFSNYKTDDHDNH